MIELQEGGRAVISFSNDAEERKILYDQIAKGLKSKETHYTYLKAVQECQALLSTVMEDTNSDKEDVILSALNVLGLCMFIKPLSRTILPEKARSVLSVLCDLLDVGTEKRRNAVYTRVLWCLSTQQLPLAIWKESAPAVLTQVTMLLACPDNISTSVDAEGLNVVKRCNEVAPDIFESRRLMVLYKGLIRILTSKSFRNYALAQSLLEQFSSASPKILRKVLLSELSQGRLTSLIQLYSDKTHSRHQLSMLHSWSLFVQYLGQTLNSASNNKFLNEMLKIVEMGFTASVGQVQEAAYKGWTVLTETFSSNPGLMESKKRMKLLMTPFVSLHSKLSDPVVCLARISSWWVLIKLALREKKHLKTSHMEDIVIPFLLSCMGVRPSATKSILEEAASVSLPQSSSHPNEDTALYCSPGSMSPEIPDMSSQSTALDINGPFFPPHSSAPLGSSPLACSTRSGAHCRAPSDPRPTSPSSPPPTPSSAPPPLLKVGRSSDIPTSTPLSSQSLLASLSQSDADPPEPSLLLSDMSDVFPECLLCALQVLLGLLGEPGTTLEGSAVALDTEQPLWSYSDWLMATYPGLVFGIVERALNALGHIDTPQLRSAIITVWKVLTARVAKTWEGEVLEEERERLVFCSHKLLHLLSKVADCPQLPWRDFGTMLESYHFCVSHFSHQDMYQEYLFSGKWRITSSVDKQVEVYPVHFLLELLLKPKFVHLSEGGGPWFDYIWEIVAGAMDSPALLENRERVFTGIVSLARALPASVYQLVEKFLADRGIEGDSQESSQNDSQEESEKNLQKGSQSDTQMDSQEDPREDPGEDSQDSQKDPGEDSQEDPGEDPQKDTKMDPQKDPGEDSQDTQMDPQKDPGEDCQDIQMDPQKDPREDPQKDPGEDSQGTQMDSPKDSQKDPGEDSQMDPQKDPLENSEEVAQKNVQEECVVLEAGEEELEAVLCSVSEGDKKEEIESKGDGDEGEDEKILNTLLASDDAGLTPSNSLVIPESDLSPATPIHGSRKRSSDDSSFLPPAKQLKMGLSPEQPVITDSDNCQQKSDNLQQPLLNDNCEQMLDNDDSQELLLSDNCQQPLANGSCQQPTVEDSQQQRSPSDSHPQPSPSDNRYPLSHSDSHPLPSPSDNRQTMHDKWPTGSDHAESERVFDCMGLEEENPLPVKSSVIQGGPSVSRPSVNTSVLEHPQEQDCASMGTGVERATGGAVDMDGEEDLVCVPLPSSAPSAPRPIVLASIEKTRKRQDDGSEGSRSKRSKADTGSSVVQMPANTAASHKSVIKGPNSARTVVTSINSEHPLPAPGKEIVAADSVNDDSGLEGAPEGTKDVVMEDDQESGALESSQIDTSQELFSTPQTAINQELQLHTGSNLTSADELLETGSNLAHTGDALSSPEGSNMAQAESNPPPQVAGSNDFGRRRNLAARKRLAAFQPRSSPVVRRTISPRTEGKLSSEEKLLLRPGPSVSSSSFTSVDALRKRRIAMPSPVMSRGARAVMFALTPSRNGVKGKTPSKSPTWTSPRHIKSSHGGILRVQSQFDTPAPRTPSRRVSFADPIEEQQSPGGSVTRVSGGKGSKKSLRSKASLLQPRRLSQESKKEHTAEVETEENTSKEDDGSNASLVPTEAMVSVEHPPATEEGEGMVVVQSEYGAESMELEIPNVTLHTPTSEDDTEQSEHSEQLRVTVSERETQDVQRDDATIAVGADVPDNEESAEELNSIQESPLDEEGEREGEGEEMEGEEEEQGEETEEEMEQHVFSLAQVVQELERPISPPVIKVQDLEKPVSSLSPLAQEEETQDQDSQAVHEEAVSSTHHASTQTTDDSILQVLQTIKEHDMESLSTAELIDSQDALYTVLSRVQRKLSERLSLAI